MPQFHIKMAELKSDPVMQDDQRPSPSPRQANLTCSILDNGTDVGFPPIISTVFPTCAQFLEEASAGTDRRSTVIHQRNSCPPRKNVQHGKVRQRPPKDALDRAQRCSASTLTMTRAGGMNWKQTLPEHIQAAPISIERCRRVQFCFNEGRCNYERYFRRSALASS